MDHYMVGRSERVPGRENESSRNEFNNEAEDEYFDDIVDDTKASNKVTNNLKSANNNVAAANNSHLHRQPSLNAGNYVNSSSDLRAPAAIDGDNNNSGSLSSSTSSCGVPLTVCQVIYLGASAPENGTTGLQAVQKPLIQLYLKSGNSTSSTKATSFVSNIIRGGAEATLAVYSFGLKLIYVPSNSPSVNIWFPISNLFVCAAVRCVRSLPLNRRFVPLDLAEADESDEAPLFAAIFRQSRARHIKECFCFVCNSKQNAMDLVLACTHAFETFVHKRPRPDCVRGRNAETSDGYEIAGAKSSPEVDEARSSESDEQNEEWQPILVRRVWLPAPAPPMQHKMFYTTASRSTSNLRKKMFNRKNKLNKCANHFSSERQQPQQQQQQQQTSHNCCDQHRGKLASRHSTMLRWPSADAALATSSNRFFVPPVGIHRSRHPQQQQQHLLRPSRWHQQPLSVSSQSLHGDTCKDEIALNRLLRTVSQPNKKGRDVLTFKPSSSTMLHPCHRQWSSQPTLETTADVVTRDGLVELARWRDGSKPRKTSFVNKFCNLIFPSSKREFNNDIQQCRRGNCMIRGNCGHQQGNMIDYATVASDEADLLRVQSDCYGGMVAAGGNNTLTRHPLPNEKAFMVSIQNQCKVSGPTTSSVGSCMAKQRCGKIGDMMATGNQNIGARMPTSWLGKGKSHQLSSNNNAKHNKKQLIDSHRQPTKHYNFSTFSTIATPPSYWGD